MPQGTNQITLEIIAESGTGTAGTVLAAGTVPPVRYRREYTDEESGVTYLEMTQTGCIEDLYEEFKDQVPKRDISTPMPPHTFCMLLCQC